MKFAISALCFSAAAASDKYFHHSTESADLNVCPTCDVVDDKVVVRWDSLSIRHRDKAWHCTRGAGDTCACDCGFPSSGDTLGMAWLNNDGCHLITNNGHTHYLNTNVDGESCEGANQPSSSTTGSSCAAILAGNSNAADGVYTLTDQGNTYEAYCDMTNGGWELVMRVGSTSSQFTWSSAYWKNTNTLNSANPEPTTNSDAKYEGFGHTVASQIRGCFTGVSDADCNSYDLAGSNTLSSLFSTTPESTTGLTFSNGGGGASGLTSEQSKWLSMADYTCADTTAQCNWVGTGINRDDTESSGTHGKVRFGMLINNEGNIKTTNDAVGFGAVEAGNYNAGAGVVLWSSFSEHSSNKYLQGTIWVK